MVSILLITHGKIAESMRQVAQGIMPDKAKAIHIIPWGLSSKPNEVPTNVNVVIDSINEGDGVLILTDLCGATPFNTVKDLANNDSIRVVCGLNLPMLLRVLNYIDESSLDNLVTIASDGGHKGITVI